MNGIYEIPKFWINLNGLAHSSNLNIMECCITRVFCMQGALVFHHWLMDIIPVVVKRLSGNSWLDKLASNVLQAIRKRQITTFNSADYLPNLNFHRVYSLKRMAFRYDQTELIISVTSSIVRYWLQFPSDEFSLLQLSVIDIISSKSLPSVLFLDKVWDMYKSPFTTIFNKWTKKSSKTKMKNSLTKFEKDFSGHPFADNDSLEYNKLKYLSELIAEWMEGNDINLETAGMAS